MTDIDTTGPSTPDPDPDPAPDPATPARDADPGPTPDPATPARDPERDPTPRNRPRPSGPVQYKGEELDPARGPGLGCFRFQLAALAWLIILTPLSVVWKWPDVVSAGLLFAVIGLLLVTGQTIIFLLRLVAADRRGRRRPLGSATRTVGEIEDEAAPEDDPHLARSADPDEPADHEKPADDEKPADQKPADDEKPADG